MYNLVIILPAYEQQLFACREKISEEVKESEQIGAATVS